MQSINEKLLRSDNYNLIKPILPQNIDIYCFEMRKVNYGWKTIASNWNRFGYITPDQCKPDNTLSVHSTLSKIKQDLDGEHYIRFPAINRVTYPSDIYQVIIECETLEESENIRKILREFNSKDNHNSFQFMLDYEYVNQIPCTCS